MPLTNINLIDNEAVRIIGNSGEKKKARGKLTYVANPNDGDTVTIDRVTYEFDSNSSLTNTSRTAIAITDTKESTFIKLRDLINA